MIKTNSKWLPKWSELYEIAVPVEELKKTVASGSLPSIAFLFMLICSTVVATLGLVINSPAVIIGAMIIAPLMSPIVSFSFGIVSGNAILAVRSLFTILIGIVITIGLSYLITEWIGWRIGGSELAARTHPNLLDLAVAIAAGAAAAFAFTRPSVSAALAGIAIAVALIPPLCTVGIAISIGQNATTEVGITLNELTPRGPFLLFMTNLIGIVLAAGTVFFWKYFRWNFRSILALCIVMSSFVLVIPPLGVGMDNLVARNTIHRKLIDKTQSLLPKNSRIRFTNIDVRIQDGTAFVQGDMVATAGLIDQALVETLRLELESLVKMPCVLEFGVIPERVFSSTSPESRPNR